MNKKHTLIRNTHSTSLTRNTRFTRNKTMSSGEESDAWSFNPGLMSLDNNFLMTSSPGRKNSFQRFDEGNTIGGGLRTPTDDFLDFDSVSSSNKGSFKTTPKKRTHTDMSTTLNIDEVLESLLSAEKNLVTDNNLIESFLSEEKNLVTDNKQRTLLHYFKKAPVDLVVKNVTDKKVKVVSPTTVQELTEDVMLGNTTLENIQKNYTSDGTWIISDEESSEDDDSDAEDPGDTETTTQQETEDLEASDKTVNEVAEKRTTKRYKLTNNFKKVCVGRARNVNGDFHYFCTFCTNHYPLSKNLIWHLWGKKGHQCLKPGNEKYRWINPSECVEAQQKFMADNGWTFEYNSSVQLVPDNFDPKPHHCPAEGCLMKFHEKRGLKKHIEITGDTAHDNAAVVLGYKI